MVEGNIEVPGGQIGQGQAQILDGRQAIAYVQNAVNRADMDAFRRRQLALQEAALAQKAAKEAQDNEVVAKFDVAKGNDFQSIVAADTAKAIQNAKSVYMNPFATKAQKGQAIEDVNFLTNSKNVWSTQQKAKFDDAETRLKPYYNTPATNRVNVLGALAQNAGDKYFMHDFAPDYEASIRTNPSLYNWNSAGNILAEKVKTLSNDYISPTGTGSKTKYSQFYSGKKDPATGLPVINYDIAQQIANGDEETRNMVDTYSKAIEPQIIAANPNLKGTQVEKEARRIALNKLFEGKGVFETETDNQSTAQKKANEAKGEKMGDIERSESNFTRRVGFYGPETEREESRTNPTTGKPYTAIVKGRRKWALPGSFGPAENTRLNKGEAEVGANRTVYLMNRPSEVDAKILQPNDDGSYQTSFGFTTKTWDKLKDGVWVTTESVGKVPGMKDHDPIPAGTPVTKDVGARLAKSNPNSVKRIQAYVVSPTQLQKVFNGDGFEDDAAALFFKNPKNKDMEFVIPVNQAGEFMPYAQKGVSQGSKPFKF